MYFSYRQVKDLVANALVVRTSVDPLSLGTSVRNAIWSVDKDQTVANIDSMEHIVAGAVARQRFSMLLLAIFAGLALVLAAVGIYGVMSFSVNQRRQEFGVRMALGAHTSRILKMVLRQGAWQVGLGLAAGMGLTLTLATLASTGIQGVLYGVSGRDPMSYGLVTALITIVALVAMLVPAQRATRVDPMSALRAE